jgi:hypothetical protein
MKSITKTRAAPHVIHDLLSLHEKGKKKYNGNMGDVPFFFALIP